MDAAPDRPPFAVLSHHRCGSNFLVSLLRAHPAISCLTEPLAQHLRLFVERDLEPWSASPPRSAAVALSDPFAHAHLSELRAWLTSTSTARVRGFKETRLAEKLSWFETHVSPVRLIVLIRDPRAVLASIVAHPELIDYWIPAAQLAYIPHRDRPTDPDDVAARSAAIWAHRYSHLADRSALLVHLESLVDDLEISLDQITTYLGLSPHTRPLRINTGHDAPDVKGTYSTIRRPTDVLDHWRTVLSHRDEITTLRIAGPVMERLGYPTRENTSCRQQPPGSRHSSTRSATFSPIRRSVTSSATTPALPVPDGSPTTPSPT